MIAKVSGPGHQMSTYELSDHQMAAGSTLGGPKAVMLLKPTGAIEKFYSIEAGEDIFGTLVLHHWDRDSGIPLTALPGEFILHPNRQDHLFELSNGVTVRETAFVLNGKPSGPRMHNVDPPAAYFTVDLQNDGGEAVNVATYASIQLKGGFTGPHTVDWDRRRNAFVTHGPADGGIVSYAACSIKPASYEVTLDAAKANATSFRGALGDDTLDGADEPIGIFHIDSRLKPGQAARFYFVLSFSVDGADAAERAFEALPNAEDALRRTHEHFNSVLDCAVVMTPDPDVNRGVLWAKANMLRVELLAPQGWCFVNDPTRSNNSVGRDTAWFAFGSDYVTPHFSRESLLWYTDHIEPDGMVVEYYDIRTGKSEDYGLNINDDTPLILLALWHHYNTTGDRKFLEDVYPKAVRMGRYILSQRDDRGLVWCTADGTWEQGICGWRNVIENYRLSGAVTEVNSECFAALRTIATMAHELGREKDAEEFEDHAAALRDAINTHLLDESRGIYYLNIDIDGTKRTDVTSDLVFPVMFGVADHETSAHIISRLSVPEFWSDAGIHTVPRTSINYTPIHGFGLLGGVWVGVTFWYAFAAAPFNPEFMAYALSTSFKHYSLDPRRNNTVPGQFCEWLHGETLANQGMMLSPWYPPRYLWAAIEGAAGLEMTGTPPKLNPRLARNWKWMGVRNLLLRGKHISWFAVRMETLTVYVNHPFESVDEEKRFDEDISHLAHASGDDVVLIALRREDCVVIFIGNTLDRTVTTAVKLRDVQLPEGYAMRVHNSLRGEWTGVDDFDSRRLKEGIAIQVDRGGFCVVEFHKKE